MAMTAWALKGAARRGITNKEMLRKESTCDSEGDLDFTETLSEGIFVIDNSSTLPNERDACSTQWERSSLQMPLLWGAQLQFCLRTEARAREREREREQEEREARWECGRSSAHAAHRAGHKYLPGAVFNKRRQQ